MTTLQKEKQHLLNRVASLNSLEDVQELAKVVDTMLQTPTSAEASTDYLLALAQKGRAQIAAGQSGTWADAQAAMQRGRAKGAAIRKQRETNG
jgi:hypothetical protein